MGDKKIAVLIDAENISNRYVKLILDEVSSFGIATYKRLYGDFQNSSVKAWLKDIQEYAITPIFQCNYTQGKNASDSALIIDAMDILYSDNVDGFCIVTSDSDFTKLVMRLRESGMTVIGMGERKTPNSLVSSCETFKFLDIIYNAEDKKTNNAPSEEKKTKGSARESVAVEKERETAANNIPSLAEIKKEVFSVIDAYAGDDGWLNLSELGTNLPKRVPGFDPRNYECGKLKQFIEKFDQIEVKSTENPNNKLLSIVFVRIKR